MAIQDVLSRVQDVLTVRRVYGEPYEHDGALIVPAAAVRGGGGGGAGGGSDARGGKGEGEGLGFGVSARPVGVFVFKGDETTWRPAVDVTRMFVMACLVPIVYFVTSARVKRARARAKR